MTERDRERVSKILTRIEMKSKETEYQIECIVVCFFCGCMVNFSHLRFLFFVLASWSECFNFNYGIIRIFFFWWNIFFSLFFIFLCFFCLLACLLVCLLCIVFLFNTRTKSESLFLALFYLHVVIWPDSRMRPLRCHHQRVHYQTCHQMYAIHIY